MKTHVFVIQMILLAIFFSSTASADGHGGWGWGRPHHGWGHHHHHHHGWGPGPQINNYYYQRPPVHYYPRPQVNNYYAPPPMPYYPPRPQYNYYGGSNAGLAGGVIGSVFGYQMGNGDPVSTGIGAAAGSFLGNGIGWR